MKKAFTIAEALIILLALSLLAVSVVPSLTKRHIQVSEHGKWICTVDNNGNHYVSTEYKGKFSNFQLVGSSCSFTPPPTAKSITVKAVAGGGAGAMGESGKDETLYDSRNGVDSGVISVKRAGTYSVVAVGGGGAGGGFGCVMPSTSDPNHPLNIISKARPAEQGGAKVKVDGVPNPENTPNLLGEDWEWTIDNSKEKGGYYNVSGLVDGNLATFKGTKDEAYPKGTYPNNYADPKFRKDDESLLYGYYDVLLDDNGKNSNYATIMPTAFPYTYLVKNDEKYTDASKRADSKLQWTNEKNEKQEAVSLYDFKYKYLNKYWQTKNGNPAATKGNGICFANNDNKNEPFATKYTLGGQDVYGMYIAKDDTDSNKVHYPCWNLPSGGGLQGGSISRSLYLPVGTNIIASVGKGGKANIYQNSNPITLQNHDGRMNNQITGFAGGKGFNGEASSVQIGLNQVLSASGGKGGAPREGITLQYQNIPVWECPIKRKVYRYANNRACVGASGPTKTNQTCLGWEASQYGTAKALSCKDRGKDCTGTDRWEFHHCEPKQADLDAGYGDHCSSKYSESSCNSGWQRYIGTGSCQVVTKKVTDAEGNETTVFDKCKAEHSTYNSSCSWRTSESSCRNGSYSRYAQHYCTTIKWNRAYCSTGTHEGYKYEKSAASDCKVVVRRTYFIVPACWTGEGATGGSTLEQYYDIPGVYGDLNLKIRDWTDPEIVNIGSYGRAFYHSGKSGYGSGGHGVGLAAYSYLDIEKVGGQLKAFGTFAGNDGEDGFVRISRISYGAGGGGQAGQYASFVLRKTGRLNITVGKGGMGTSQGREGGHGGNTVIRDASGTTLFDLAGGRGGIFPARDEAEVGDGYVAGVDGALSPMESPYNKAREIPYGGKRGTNANSFDGVSPVTPKWCRVNQCGNRLVMSYGAGGGGGAGSKTQFGKGGSGAAGAVVIEW